MQESEAVAYGGVPEGSSSARVVTSGWHKCWNTLESVTVMSLRPQPVQETDAVAWDDGPEGSSSASVVTSGVHKCVDKLDVGTAKALESRDGTADGGMLEGTP